MIFNVQILPEHLPYKLNISQLIFQFDIQLPKPGPSTLIFFPMSKPFHLQ